MFIRLTTLWSPGREMRLHVRHIVAYYPKNVRSISGVGPDVPGSEILTTDEGCWQVREAPEQIDALIAAAASD